MATETERHVLYEGRVVIDFYPKSHRYKLVELDGEERKDWLKSPSSIVGKLDKSAPLMYWATGCFYDRMLEEMRDGVSFTKDDILAMLEVSKGAYREKRDQAADVGTVVHDYAQKHNEEGINSVEDIDGYEDLDEADKVKAQNGQKAFDTWYAQLGGKSVESEFLVFSEKENFVGRCDDLVELDNGDLVILDYKTSKGVYTSQVYQVASYMKAREEEYPEQRIAGARLVHLIKDDVEDKDGNIIKRAGEYGEVYLTRGDLVQAYMVFKALNLVATKDPEIEKLIK